jgi:agmatinase
MGLEDAKNEVDSAFTRKGLRGYAFENAFGGATSFLRRTYTKDLTGVDLAVTGVPFDQAVDYGDLAFDYAKVSDFPDALTAHIRTILAAGAGSVTLGGDHYITYPILRAYAEKYGPMGVIHFDAHSDLWQDDDYTRIDHGTMMYKAVKSGLVDPKRSVQIGIRTHTDDYLGVSVIDAREVHEKGAAAAVARARAIVGDGPTYLTFDIDALDPAFAPGTGTPVWGGLASWQAAAMLRDLAGINMVGGDIVEVSSPYDTTGATAIAGAHVAYDLIALFAWAKARRG